MENEIYGKSSGTPIHRQADSNHNYYLNMHTDMDCNPESRMTKQTKDYEEPKNLKMSTSDIGAKPQLNYSSYGAFTRNIPSMQQDKKALNNSNLITNHVKSSFYEETGKRQYHKGTKSYAPSAKKVNTSYLNTQEYLDNFNDKAQELNSHLDEFMSIKKANSSLESSVKVLENEISRLNEDLNVCSKRIKEYQSQENRFNQKLEQIKKAYVSLSQENSELKLTIQSISEEKAKVLEERSKQIEREIIIHSQVSKYDEEIKQLNNEIQDILNAGNLREEAFKQKLFKVHQDHKSEISQLSNFHKNEIQNLSKQYEIKSEESRQLAEELCKLRKQSENAGYENTRIIEEQKENIEAKAQRLNLLETRFEETEAELKSLTSKYNDLLRDYDSGMQQCKNQINSLEQEKQKLVKAFNNMSKQEELNLKISSIISPKKDMNTSDIKSKTYINTNTSYCSNVSTNIRKVNNPNSQNTLKQKPASRTDENIQIYPNSSQQFNQNESAVYTTKECSKLKSICLEQENEIAGLTNKLNQERSYFEMIISNLKCTQEEKLEELHAAYKRIKNLEKELEKKNDEIGDLRLSIKEYKQSIQNEISNKNEEIYQLKTACDKMLSKVYKNMEKALYQ